VHAHDRVRAADALTAADRLLQSKEAVAAVARRHGYAATFVPKPFPNQAGSGSHVHMSLWRVSHHMGAEAGRKGTLCKATEQGYAEEGDQLGQFGVERWDVWDGGGGEAWAGCRL
jgi:glutamine synthetase